MNIRPWDEICELIPPLSQAERQRLLDSIERDGGVRVPVLTMADGRIIDGHHRWELAGDKCRIEVADLSETDGLMLAIQLNIARRNLSPEQLKPLIEHLRKQGMTQVQVAESLGICDSTVSNLENQSNSTDGITLDQRLSVPKEEYPIIAERRETGEPLVTIAADYKVTPERIGQIVTLVESRSRVPEPIDGDIALPDQKFRCIVIDPPWPVQKIEREERPNQSQTLDYPTMTIEQIRALPITDLANPKGCHVYLWVTQKFLPAGLDLFEEWGVHYQCLMTWVKPTGITPYSWMYNTEHVVFGRIGNIGLDQLGLKLSFDAPVIRHSQKPDVFYDRVRAASPDPRLEMFARKPYEGFVPWGNEVTA